MANYDYKVSYLDADGDDSSWSGSLVAASEAAALAALQAAVETADVLTGAVVTNVSLTIAVDISAWTLKAAAAANSDVEIGGRFIFRAANPRFTKEITIPGFEKDTYVNNKAIDLLDADVAAFTTAITFNGHSTSHFEDLTAVVKGYETFNGRA